MIGEKNKCLSTNLNVHILKLFALQKRQVYAYYDSESLDTVSIALITSRRVCFDQSDDSNSIRVGGVTDNNIKQYNNFEEDVHEWKTGDMDVEFLRYQFEEGYEDVAVKRRFRIGVRHLQILYMLVCSTVMGTMRSTTGVAVLAMTDATRRNDTYIQIHDWDRRIQGMVLSSFFFGYALMLVPAELFLNKFGGKWTLTASLLVNGALCAAMPTIANKGGWIAVCNAQLLMGMTQSCLAPANQSLLANWLPPNERKFFGPLIFGGNLLGIVIALPISGLLSEAALGWELIFYAQAMQMLSMAAVWGLLTASSPERHQAIGDAEKEYIEETLKAHHKKSVQRPWRAIMKSSHFWAVMSAHAASNAVFTFFLVEVPAYLQSFRISLRDSSWQSLLPFAVMWLMHVSTAPIVAWLHETGCISYVMSLTHFRKLINALGAFGMATGLTMLSYLSPDSGHLALTVLIGILGLLGFQYSGFLGNHGDMSPDHSGTTLMMTNAFGGLVGSAVPYISGLIISDNLLYYKPADPPGLQRQLYLPISAGSVESKHPNADQSRWRIVLLSLASACIVCNIIYTVLGTSERQDWSYRGVKQKFGYHNELELEELKDSILFRTKDHTDV